MGAHPLAERCPARSKQTGEQCKRRVIGGGPCRSHGGAAPQVAAARERRIVAAEAAAAGASWSERPAHEALADAAGTADRIVRQLRSQLEAGEIEPKTLEVLGAWLDRTGRLTKAVLDSRIDERRVQLQEAQRLQVVAVVRGALRALGLDPDDDAVLDAVRSAATALGGRPTVVVGELVEGAP